MGSGCAICDELLGKPNSRLSLALGDPNVRNAVFSYTDSYAVIPSVGPLVVGHSLIVTRRHSSCVLGSLDPSIAEDLTRTLSNFIARIRTAGGFEEEFLCFEHGSTVACDGSSHCSTSHGHLHLLPAAQAIRRVALDSVEGECFHPGALLPVADHARRYSQYLAVFCVTAGLRVGTAKLRDAGRLPPQYMRMVIANALGRSDWDWKQYSRHELLAQTIQLGFPLNVPMGDQRSTTQ
jgi:hypothetical protein